MSEFTLIFQPLSRVVTVYSVYDPQIDLPDELQDILRKEAAVEYVIKMETAETVQSTKSTLGAKAVEFKKEYCHYHETQKHERTNHQLLTLERVIDTIDYQYQWEDDSKEKTPQYTDRIIVHSHHHSAPQFLLDDETKINDSSFPTTKYPEIEGVSQDMMRQILIMDADSRLISNIYHSLVIPQYMEMLLERSGNVPISETAKAPELFSKLGVWRKAPEPATEPEASNPSPHDLITKSLSPLDDLYHGGEFLPRNENLLIDDSFIPYAYYTFLFSHIIKELCIYSPFQFCMSFIARDIISTDATEVNPPQFLGTDIGGPLSNMESIEMEGNSLSEDIAIMFGFMRETIPTKLNYQRINVIVDRRNQVHGENSAIIYVHHCPMYGHSVNIDNTANTETAKEFVPMKVNKRPKDDVSDEIQQEMEGGVPTELSILSMNMTSTIPNLSRSQNNNPFLMHLNFYPLDGKQCLAYFIRNGSCIRFFPEIMMDYWRRFFFNDATYLRDIAYHHKFRHSFALPLYDDTLTETYYCLHRVQFCSVNYYRPRVEYDDQYMVKPTKKTKIADSVKLKKFESLCINSPSAEGTVDFKTCFAIKRICFLLSMQQNFDELLAIAMQCGYSTVNLMDDAHRLFVSHKFLTDNDEYQKIRDWLLAKKTIGKCTEQNPDNCPSMIRCD